MRAALSATFPSAPAGPRLPPQMHDASRDASPSVSDVQVLLPSVPPSPVPLSCRSPSSSALLPVACGSACLSPQPSLCATAVAPASSTTPQRPGHELHSWGESLFSSCSEQLIEEGGKRWYHSIPMPQVEPVDKGLLFEESDEVCRRRGLDGLRLATLSAVRDLETAMARELQAGHGELAKLTAQTVADMYATVDNLEEFLHIVAYDVAELYEQHELQNRDVAIRTVTPEEGIELLQAKVVPITEVCERIDEWREAIGEEVASVINKHKAGTFRTEQEVKAVESEDKYQVVRVPGKLVAAIKPPRRFKARLVACGNFLHREKTRKSATLDRTDLYCSNLDIFSLRIQLAIGAQKGWRAASIDVKTAFLTAPYQPGRATDPQKEPKMIFVKVPRAVVLASFAPADTSR